MRHARVRAPRCTKLFCRRFALGLLHRRSTFIEQLLSLLANVLLLAVVEELSVGPGVLCANHSFTINEDHERNQRPLVGRPLQILQSTQAPGRPNGKRRIVSLNEIGNVRVLIHRPFSHLKSFGLQILGYATQDLSGLLAVRSSGEDEYQAQNFALVTAHQQLLAVGELDGKLGRLPGNLSRECRAREQCQREKYLQAHLEI